MKTVRIIHKIATLLVLAIGCIHTAASFYFFSTIEENAVWFAGAGLAAIFVAFINMTLWDAVPTVKLRRLVDMANLFFSAWLVFGVIGMPNIPTYAIASIGFVMALCGLLLPRH